MTRVNSLEGITNFIGGLNTSVGSINNPGNLLEEALNVEIGLDGSLSSRRPFSLKTALASVSIVSPQSGYGTPGFTSTAYKNLGSLLLGPSTAIHFIDIKYWEAKDIYAVLFYGESDYVTDTRFLAVAFLEEDEDGDVSFNNEAVAFGFGAFWGEYTGGVEFGESSVYIPARQAYTILPYGSVHYFVVDYNDMSANIDGAPGIKYRDFIGVPNRRSGTTSDNNVVGTDERLGTISSFQAYNIINSGWPTGVSACSVDESGTDTTDAYPIHYSRSQIGKFPALCDRFAVCKIREPSRYTSLDSYSCWQMAKNKTVKYAYVPSGSTLVTLGAENDDRYDVIDGYPSTITVVSGETTTQVSVITNQSDLASYKNKSEQFKPYHTALAEIDGRMWYAIKNREFNLAFSQVKDKTDWQWRGKCYQAADPTDDIENNLVATDGGTISVTGCGDIHKFKKFGSYIILFCSDGVWALYGNRPGESFRPNSFSVSKISHNVLVDETMVAEGDGSLLFLAYDGLQRMVQSDSGLQVINISNNRVDDVVNNFIKSIPIRKGAGLPDVGLISYDKSSGRFYITSKMDKAPIARVETLVYDSKIDSYYQWDISSRGYTYVDPYPTSQAKRDKSKEPLVVGSFNKGGTFVFAYAPLLSNVGDFIQYYQDFYPRLHSADGSSSGCYVYRQPDPLHSYASASVWRMLDFSYDYDYNGDVGHNNYISTARLSYSGNSFYTNKIIENFLVVYENKHYYVTGDDDSNTYVGPKLFVKPVWDWNNVVDYPEINIQGYIKTPYQVNYDANTYLIHKGKIPGKGNILSLDFYIPLDTDCTGFKIIGYSGLMSSNRRP